MNVLAAGSFDHGDMITFFLSLAILIGSARILGELAEKFKQPAILGELMAGIILGPSVLGMIAPELKASLFPSEGPVFIGLQFMSSLAIAGPLVATVTTVESPSFTVTVFLVVVMFTDVMLCSPHS